MFMPGMGMPIGGICMPIGGMGMFIGGICMPGMGGIWFMNILFMAAIAAGGTTGAPGAGMGMPGAVGMPGAGMLTVLFGYATRSGFSASAKTLVLPSSSFLATHAQPGCAKVTLAKPRDLPFERHSPITQLFTSPNFSTASCTSCSLVHCERQKEKT